MGAPTAPHGMSAPVGEGGSPMGAPMDGWGAVGAPWGAVGVSMAPIAPEEPRALKKDTESMPAS